MRVLLGVIILLLLFVISSFLLELLWVPFMCALTGGKYQQQHPLEKHRKIMQSLEGLPKKLTYVSTNVEQNELKRLFTKNFSAGDFDVLERIAAKFRSSMSRTKEGRLKLLHFYTGIDDFTRNSVHDNKVFDSVKHAKKWIAQRPGSITAHKVLARILINKAWAARGSGYAGSVSKEGWKGFNEYLNEAKLVLEKATKLKDKDPVLYNDFASVGRGLSWSKEKRMIPFKEGQKLFPAYYTIYQSEAGTRLPRWGGSKKDVADFAMTWSKKVGGEEGLILYFWVVDRIRRYFGHGLIVDGCVVPFDNKRLVKGAWVLLRKYPCIRNYARVSHYAVWLKDKELAKFCFEGMGNRFPSAFYSKLTRFAAYRRWALLNGPYPLHP